MSFSISAGFYSIILQCKEFLYSYFSLTDRLIGSIHYFTTGLYGFHVLLGVFLGIIMDDMIIIIIDYFSLVCLFFYLIPLNTLLWSLFKAIVLNDIKSIIALSTINWKFSSYF